MTPGAAVSVFADLWIEQAGKDPMKHGAMLVEVVLQSCAPSLHFSAQDFEISELQALVDELSGRARSESQLVGSFLKKGKNDKKFVIRFNELWSYITKCSPQEFLVEQGLIAQVFECVVAFSK
jgi:hypothetical protein